VPHGGAAALAAGDHHYITTHFMYIAQLCILLLLLLLLIDLNDNAVVTSFGRVGGGKRRKGRDAHSMGCWLMHYERVVVCCAYRVPFKTSATAKSTWIVENALYWLICS
jgi:hypothetical protein